MRVLTIVLSVFFVVTTYSQNYKFGKVSKEELEETVNTIDSTANAAYLYKYRRTHFRYQQGEGFILMTDIRERIKIYNQDGVDYATKRIVLYKSGGVKEKVSSLKANTFNLVDGKIEETKLKRDGIFNTELSKNFDETKFTMPNIKEGSVIEYEYTITSPYYQNVDEFVFQHDIPVKKIEARFEAPEFFKFKMNSRGYLSVIPKTENKNDQITFRNTTRTAGGLQGPTNTKFSSSSLDFMKEIRSYDLSNIPALKDEPYVNNINNYRSSVKFELSFVKYPDAPIKYYSTTWEDVVKTIYDSPYFGAELNKKSYFEKDIDALLATSTDPIKKIGAIYNYVKSNIKWNGGYGKYTRSGVRKAYKEQVGNVAEINLMLTAMLRHAGLKANPVLVSTRKNGVPLFPTREGYNYVISSVQLPQGSVLLDATNKYGMPNILPFRTLNWQGRIVTKDGGSKLINLYPKTKSKSTITLMAKIGEDGVLEGGFRNVRTNHTALSFRNRYNNADKDNFLEKLENKYEGLEISDYVVKNDLNLSKPVIESYNFIKEDQADIIGDKIYFSPLFYLKTGENPFKLEKREFPVDFGYPSITSYNIVLNIPEGYKIESLPESMGIGLPDNLGSYKYHIKSNGNTVQISIITKINESIISSMYYETLKEYFNKFIQKEGEQIVLTKT